MFLNWIFVYCETLYVEVEVTNYYSLNDPIVGNHNWLRSDTLHSSTRGLIKTITFVSVISFH
jgi:hypothetical protein